MCILKRFFAVSKTVALKNSDILNSDLSIIILTGFIILNFLRSRSKIIKMGFYSKKTRKNNYY